MGPATARIENVVALTTLGLSQKKYQDITIYFGFPQPTMVAEGESCIRVRRLPGGGGSGAGL